MTPAKLASRVARLWIHRVLVALILVIGGSTALNVGWLYRLRFGFPTEWDESGYIAIAVRDTHALQDGGLLSLARMVETQGVEAPLVPFTTVPLHLLFGTGVSESLLVLPVFFAGLLLATYGVAKRLLPPRWAVLATLTVAAIPDVTDHTRLYHFSVPAAAFLTAAAWALLRSERLSRRGFALVGGVFVGLMLLARTMTIAYVPAIAAFALVQLFVSSHARRRRAVNLALASTTALAVSSIWYARNWSGVRDYLLGAGFGSESRLYGARPSILSIDFWTRDLLRVANELYLPLATALAAVAIVAALGVVARGRPPRWRAWIASDALLLVFLVVEGYLAVSATGNAGTAFELPWLPALVILVVAAAANVEIRSLQIAFAATIAGTALAALAMKSGFISELSAVRQAHVPGLGRVVVTDGRDVMQRELAAGGYKAGDGTKATPRFQRRWPAFQRFMVERIEEGARRYGLEPRGLLAANSPILTNTSLALAAALDRTPLAIGWLRSTSDTEDEYAEQLQKSNARFMLAVESPLHAQATLTLAYAEEAALSLGFARIEVFVMPDGGQAWLYWRRR